jgi:hypothetical protein
VEEGWVGGEDGCAWHDAVIDSYNAWLFLASVGSRFLILAFILCIYYLSIYYLAPTQKHCLCCYELAASDQWPNKKVQKYQKSVQVLCWVRLRAVLLFRVFQLNALSVICNMKQQRLYLLFQYYLIYSKKLTVLNFWVNFMSKGKNKTNKTKVSLDIVMILYEERKI